MIRSSSLSPVPPRPSTPLRPLRFVSSSRAWFVAIASLLVSFPAFAQRVATPAHPPPVDVRFEVFAGHPRCVFRPADRAGGGRTFAQVRELYAKDATFRSIMDRALAQSPERQHAPPGCSSRSCRPW